MKLDNWQNHEPILLAFEAAWEAEGEPNPDTFANQSDDAGKLQLLAELVMIDFEHRSRRSIAVSLDHYFKLNPELKDDPEILEELVRHEFRLRRKFGTYPTAAEIDSRFGDGSTAKEIWYRIAESEDASGLQVGQIPTGTIVGSYVIDGVIGVGAFATVYSAVDSRLNRRVAIKILMQSSDTRPEIRLRMQREAKAIASINHPCIVPIYENGSYRSHDYIVTRYVDGMTLEQELRKTEFAVAEAVQLVCQLASALVAVHALGVVHRDIKPANIMLEDGTPQLVDFGLAALDNASHLLTYEGDVVGTPAYMPPEQADGKAMEADGRSDIYSLGATLYRLICGVVPFEGTTPEVIGKVLRTEPTLPKATVQRIGKDLQTIILKCLQKDREDRYLTAADLEADLNRYRAGKPIHARSISLITRVRKWVKRRPAVACMTMTAIAAVGFLLYQNGQLDRVASERDTAQQSSQATRIELQASATDAGLLALQQGQIDDGIAYLRQSLNPNSEGRVDILLKLVEANLQKGDTAAAQQWWYKAEACLTTDQLLPDQQHQSFEGLLLLWQAELALANGSTDGSGTPPAEDLLRQARQMDLPIAEQHYIDGLLASSTLEALKHLQAAIKVDPFHQRARLTLIATQLSLAMIPEATAGLHDARQLDPESVDYLLLEGFVASLTAQPNLTDGLLQSTNLSVDQQQEWADFYLLLNSVVSNPLFADGMGELKPTQFASAIELLCGRFESLHHPRQWNLPFVTTVQCEYLQYALPVVLRTDADAAILMLDSVVKVHPESSLVLALGSLRLGKCTGLPENSEREIPLLESAAQDYRLALTRPGLLMHDDQIAWKALFAISTVLADIMKHDIDSNLKQRFEATTKVRTESIKNPSQARTFTILNLTNDKYSEADRWVDRWMNLTSAAEASGQEAIWHKAVISKRLENWVDVIEWCDALMAQNPDDPHVKALRATAKNQLRQVLDQ